MFGLHFHRQETTNFSFSDIQHSAYFLVWTEILKISYYFFNIKATRIIGFYSF